MARSDQEEFRSIIDDNTSGSVELSMRVFSFLHRHPERRYYETILESFVGMALVRNAARIAISDPDMSPDNFRDIMLTQERKSIENALNGIDAEAITTMSNSHNVREFISSSDSIKRVYVLESRPMLEGRIMAKTLYESGKDVYLVTDAEMCLALSMSDAVVVGSDSVLSDLTLIHKVGTLPLAICAYSNGLPFYSITMSMKFEQDYKSKDYPEFRQHPCSEMGYDGKCLNVYFEKTGSAYISAFFSDTGAIHGHR
ncbi:hypothetical protein [Thermoplasma sp.]|uniref:hypothetical protein n=1 Tax=Thermoplasma sp. TaxID=1973142 RepID=UPI0025D193EB|nr:hypothetical protein [Thermoplasma sp.]